ncbi:MAG: hypothetical protein PHF51_02325 [Candidatus ainarchaeum sp.]|nr:hypothetical protein [Candidatus ainarchaeum sp.]
MIVAAVLAFALLAAGCMQGASNATPAATPTPAPAAAPTATPGLFGNDSDAHGCRASAGYSWCEPKQRCIRVWEENCTAELDGGDRDEHGCIGSAGYVWCPEQGKCLRVWEEYCNASTLNAQAESYCGGENVGAVYVCGDYFRVVSTMPGAGSTIYRNGSTISCPLVAPDSMSEECRMYVLGSNCAETDVCANGTGMPGSDRDSHGCIPSAGYSWCGAKNKCIRMWEENCAGEGGNCTTVSDCGMGAARCVGGKCTQYDEDGCVPDGGYTWCEARHECIQPWAENCTAGE